jgi:O-antigen ligase
MWRLAEKCYVIVALLYFSGAIVPLIRGDSGNSGPNASDPLLFIIQTLIYCAMCVFIAPHLDQCFQVGRKLTWILLLLGLALASTMWSNDPSISIRKGIVVCLTALFGVYFASRFSPRQQMRLLAIALGIVALLSVVCVVALPAHGIEHGFHEGEWRGVFETKNELGRAMALSWLVLIVAGAARVINRAAAWSGACVSAVLLWQSGSRTALVVGLMLIVLFYSYPRLLKVRLTVLLPVLVVLTSLFIAALALIAENSKEVFQFFGQDETLTGRTVLWANVALAIAKRPWLGYGFSAFWAGMQGASADILTVVKWEAPHAHNGILDLWLDLGVVGVALFLIGFTVAFARAVRLYRSTRTLEMMWPLIYISFLFIYNLTESAILRVNSLFWALYVAAFATLWSVRMQHELEEVKYLSSDTDLAFFRETDLIDESQMNEV